MTPREKAGAQGKGGEGPSLVWVLTDGKAGDEMPLVGVAEALGVPFEIRRVKPGLPWVWFMPYGPIDPREAPGRSGSPLSPPFPDICLATGRRAIAYARHLKRNTGCMVALFKDPRAGSGFADLVFVQEHDKLRGQNVIVTLTGPNRITDEKLEVLRQNPGPLVHPLPAPRVAVLVGGDTRRFSYTEKDRRRLLDGLAEVAKSGKSLMITASRRTPAGLMAELMELARLPNVVCWDGTGDNPYFDFLANADHVVVTSDSTNMVGEAAATGRPVYVFRPEGQDARFDALIGGLISRGVAHDFPGPMDGQSYPPLNSTGEIAARIAETYRAHQARYLARN